MRPLPRALWPLGALAAVVSSASCIAIVSPDGPGPRCRFAGEDTACGACVASKCQPAVDACCGDGECTDRGLSFVERCTQGDHRACLMLASDVGATSPVRRELARCADTECGTTCRDSTARSITACEAPTYGQGKACECTISSTANDRPCSEATYAGTICCAAAGWPAPGTECGCAPISCQDVATGRCLCVRSSGPSFAARCDGLHCCADQETCACGSEPCNTRFTTEVASCAIEELSCPSGHTRVTSCSQREP